jgi:hypothetical protein
MRRWLLAALLVPGCGDLAPDIYKDKQMESFGVKPEDMDAPPTPNEIRARVISDARKWRILRGRIDEGVAECKGIKFDAPNGPLCAADKDEMQVVDFPEEPLDKPNRVKETGYFCHKESVYYYHYEGGRERKDVWLGPFHVGWNRPKSND